MDQFQNQSTVVITLDELMTNEIPEQIGQLTHAVDLTIQLTAPDGNWAVYPPLSWYEARELKEPFRVIPESIGNLQNLKLLHLSNLEIHELPESISKLNNLEFLDLSMNKLDLSNELGKIGALAQLNHLQVFGNHFNENEMQEFIRQHPNVKIEYRGKSNLNKEL